MLLTVCFAVNTYAQEEEEDVSEYVLDEEFEWQDYNYIDTTRDLIDSVLDFKKVQKEPYLKENISIEEAEVEEKVFNQKLWEKYNKERDYLEEEQKEKEPNDWQFPNFGFEGLGFAATLFKFLVYAIIVLSIGFVIFKLLEAQFKQDSLVRKENTFFIENLEEKIHEVNLYKLLEEYQQKQDYRMLIRIYYLIIIKELSIKKYINWEIQKTNGNYIQEMFNNKLFEEFKKLTLIFERVWFGEVEINQEIFKNLEPIFKKTIENIKQGNIVGNK